MCCGRDFNFFKKIIHVPRMVPDLGNSNDAMEDGRRESDKDASNLPS